MMRVILTIKEIIERGWWEKVCEIKGYDKHAIIEGMPDTTEIEFNNAEWVKFRKLLNFLN